MKMWIKKKDCLVNLDHVISVNYVCNEYQSVDKYIYTIRFDVVSESSNVYFRYETKEQLDREFDLIWKIIKGEMGDLKYYEFDDESPE